MPASIPNPLTPSLNGSGIFFHTLRQANASAENVDNTDSTSIAGRPSTANSNTTTANNNSNSNSNTTFSAAATAAASPSVHERDIEREGDCVPAVPVPVDSNTSSHDTANANADQDVAAAPFANSAPRPAPAASSSAPPSNGGSGIKILPCGAIVGTNDRENRGWRKVVRNFTPSWFSVSMGTGVVSILLHNLPYNAHWLWYISVIVFCLNIFLFITFSVITITRYVLYPEIWNVMIKHPSQSLFLGCIPMAFSTIVKLMVLVCTPWGTWAIYVTWAFWWVDVFGSCACSLIIPFVIVHHHRNQLSHMTAALLLPVVPVVVAAATGSMIAAVLPDRSHAITTIVASYILWGLGECFSFFIMTVYFLRLQIHDLPPREVIVSVFLPISPLGQGGFTIQQLGKVAYELLPITGAFNGVVIDGTQPGALEATAMFGGTVLYMFGIIAGFFLWGAALGWIAFASISIITTKSFPFNMGWWGFVFPLGVFTSCTGMLATELSSTFFKVITMIFSASVFCLWILVAIKTSIMVYHGNMIYAPCLRDLRPLEEQPGGKRTA